jgi:dTDP-glucose 4,6-dehydratase
VRALCYGIDPTKIERELGWKSNYDFDMGLAKTVKWYVENQAWWQKIIDHDYEPRRLGFSRGQL